MTERKEPVDDITLELATVLDELSAVDCYRFKKTAPIENRSNKKPLLYDTILKSNFPGTSHTDTKYKISDSIDMEYIDMMSGKGLYTADKEGEKIVISMESFEKLCYFPKLTENQKQALESKVEGNVQKMSIYNDLKNLLLDEEISKEVDKNESKDDHGCCPFDFSKCQKNDTDNPEISMKEGSTDAEKEMSTILAKYRSDMLSDISEESSNGNDDTTSITQSEIPKISDEAQMKEVSNISISSENKVKSSEKRKKSLFKKIFFMEKGKKN